MACGEHSRAIPHLQLPITTILALRVGSSTSCSRPDESKLHWTSSWLSENQKKASHSRRSTYSNVSPDMVLLRGFKASLLKRETRGSSSHSTSFTPGMYEKEARLVVLINRIQTGEIADYGRVRKTHMVLIEEVIEKEARLRVCYEASTATQKRNSTPVLHFSERSYSAWRKC